jgi:superfamily I DNA/RNA helicase
VDNELDATLTPTTGHKSTALEWDFVSLHDDFMTDPLSPDMDQGRRDHELNLLYVSVTRGVKILALNLMVLSIMQR